MCGQIAESPNFPRAVCEHAQAYGLPEKAEAAYRRGDLIDRRVQLMKAWADYCAQPVTEARAAVVTPIRRKPSVERGQPWRHNLPDGSSPTARRAGQLRVAIVIFPCLLRDGAVSDSSASQSQCRQNASSIAVAAWK